VRQCHALQLTLERRFAGGWFASGNYTFSRLYGNYAGLAASDEILTPTTGVSSGTAQQQGGNIFREGSNVNRYWDIDEVVWDSHGKLGPRGLLATDRPHVAKLFGSYTLPEGTTLGTFFYAGSGTPVSTYMVTGNRTNVFVNGRGDMGRTPFLTQTDLLVSHSFKMGGKSLRAELNMLNVFNQRPRATSSTPTTVVPACSREHPPQVFPTSTWRTATTTRRSSRPRQMGPTPWIRASPCRTCSTRACRVTSR
jgi:hypothetical protein